jgi:hypothetical protein
LLPVYDHHVLLENKKMVLEFIKKEEKEIYECKPINDSNAYSVLIFKALHYLARAFLEQDQNDESSNRSLEEEIPNEKWN